MLSIFQIMQKNPYDGSTVLTPLVVLFAKAAVELSYQFNMYHMIY